MKNNITNIGQYNLPNWSDFEKMVDGIWERKYYTNHGPLVQQVENRLQDYLNVKHVVAMTNPHIALMISNKALGFSNENVVAYHSLSPVSVPQSIIWAGAEPMPLDTSSESMQLQVSSLANLDAESNVAGVIVNNLLNGTSQMEAISESLKKKNIKCLFFSPSGFGIQYKGINISNLGDACIFSFAEQNMLNGVDSACVCTNDDNLAARLRNIRSSYGAGRKVDIPYTGNGRMSEIQAGLILLSLDNIKQTIASGRERFDLYKAQIDNIDGLSIYNPDQLVSIHNFQDIVILINPEILKKTAFDIQDELAKENVNSLTLNNYCRSAKAPYALLENMINSINWRSRILLLPNKSGTSASDIDKICSAVKKTVQID